MLEPGAYHNAIVEACVRNRGLIDFEKYCNSLNTVASLVENAPLRYLGVFDEFCDLLDIIGDSYDRKLPTRERARKALNAGVAHLKLDISDPKVTAISAIIESSEAEDQLDGVGNRYRIQELSYNDETKDAILSIAISSRYLATELLSNRGEARGVVDVDVGGAMLGGLVGGPQGAVAIGVGMSVLALL